MVDVSTLPHAASAIELARRVTLDEALELVENLTASARLANKRGADQTLAIHLTQARLALIEALRVGKELIGGGAS